MSIPCEGANQPWRLLCVAALASDDDPRFLAALAADSQQTLPQPLTPQPPAPTPSTPPTPQTPKNQKQKQTPQSQPPGTSARRGAPVTSGFAVLDPTVVARLPPGRTLEEFRNLLAAAPRTAVAEVAACRGAGVAAATEARLRVPPGQEHLASPRGSFKLHQALVLPGCWLRMGPSCYVEVVSVQPEPPHPDTPLRIVPSTRLILAGRIGEEDDHDEEEVEVVEAASRRKLRQAEAGGEADGLEADGADSGPRRRLTQGSVVEATSSSTPSSSSTGRRRSGADAAAVAAAVPTAGAGRKAAAAAATGRQKGTSGTGSQGSQGQGPPQGTPDDGAAPSEGSNAATRAGGLSKDVRKASSGRRRAESLPSKAPHSSIAASQSCASDPATPGTASTATATAAEAAAGPLRSSGLSEGESRPGEPPSEAAAPAEGPTSESAGIAESSSAAGASKPKSSKSKPSKPKTTKGGGKSSKAAPRATGSLFAALSGLGEDEE